MKLVCWRVVDVLLLTPMRAAPAPVSAVPADRVVASADECQGHWQQKDYKAFSPGTDW
jgi:hypothetical protein